MEKYLLDTNILAFILTKNKSEISNDVANLIFNYENKLYTSSICVVELIQLFRIGKIKLKKGEKINNIHSYIDNEYGIEIMPFSQKHTETMSNLIVPEGHNDPLDHAIISQAIKDKYTLISSDNKFKAYEKQNLKFIFNKR